MIDHREKLDCGLKEPKAATVGKNIALNKNKAELC